MQRKRYAHGRHGAQPMSAWDMIDEDQLVVIQDGKVNSLTRLLGKPLQRWQAKIGNLELRGGRERNQPRPEFHAIRERGTDDQAFVFQSSDDALNSRSGKAYQFCNLAERQALRMLPQGI